MNTQDTTSNPGRDDTGRFTAGNRGGPGNPFARQVAALRQALIASVTAEDIQAVAASMLELAKRGNVQAAKVLLLYTIGKPQPAPEPDRMDTDEWNVFKETAEMKAEAPAVASTATPDYYLDSVRAMRPVVSFLHRKEVEQMVSETPAQAEEREAAEAAEATRILNTPTETPAWMLPEEEPSPNGNKRPAAEAGDRMQPSTNGDLQHASTPPDGNSRFW